MPRGDTPSMRRRKSNKGKNPRRRIVPNTTRSEQSTSPTRASRTAAINALRGAQLRTLKMTVPLRRRDGDGPARKPVAAQNKSTLRAREAATRQAQSPPANVGTQQTVKAQQSRVTGLAKARNAAAQGLTRTRSSGGRTDPAVGQSGDSHNTNRQPSQRKTQTAKTMYGSSSNNKSAVKRSTATRRASTKSKMR